MRLTSLVCAALLALPVTAGATIAPSRSGQAAFREFQGLDVDADRRLTRAELLVRGREAASDALFRLLDANGDGKLTVDEAQAAGGGPLLGRFQAYDVDRNGVVTRREFPKALDPLLFTALDHDRDGALLLGDLRPAFTGWRPSAPAVENATPRSNRQRPAPLCWVPAIGGGGWGLEMPVTAQGNGCVTRP